MASPTDKHRDITFALQIVEYYDTLFQALNNLKPQFLCTSTQLLSALSHLDKLVTMNGIEWLKEVGTKIEEVKNRIKKELSTLSSISVLPLEICNNHYKEVSEILEDFKKRIDFVWVSSPRLVRLSLEMALRELSELPGDEHVRLWLISDENRAAEFREGLWNLIYGSPTAAGLLFMRLCERATKELYKKVAGTDPTGMTWGQVLDNLERHYTEGNNAEILSLLRYLKEWRNKLAHPEKLLTQEEAEDLYVMAMRALKTVIKQLQTSSASLRTQLTTRCLPPSPAQ